MSSIGADYTSGESSNQERVDSLSVLHAVVSFQITTLVGFLQIQYQSGNISPFDEHRKLLLAIFLALSMYVMCLMAQFKLQTHRPTYVSTVKRFSPLIGILVAVLLMMILLPSLRLVAFIFWALFLAEAVIKSFQEVRQLIRDRRQNSESNTDGEENHSTANQENDMNINVSEENAHAMPV